VLTKTWFHTGVYPQGDKVSRHLEDEYYRESDLSEGIAGLTDAEFEAMLLPDTVLPAGLSADEVREACRSLKGAILRQEIYALDGKEESDRPYSVSERNYTINRVQSFGGNRHAVFFTHARETIDFHYERKLYDVGGRQLADPRVTHNMILAVDPYGNELQSVAIGYGRRHDDPDPLLTDQDRAKQKKIHITYTESVYTKPILEPDAYRPPLPAETRTYELINVTPDRSIPDITNLFDFEELASTDAYDMAKRAERAFRFERGLTTSGFINFGYWDSLRRGLLSGEQLYLDLKRLEMAYLDQNARDYEITKHVSLVLHDPIALITLKQTGRCEVDLPESLFDSDYP
jgi:hypothetical protein